MIILDQTKLKDLRRTRKLKLAEVANKTGLSVSQLSNYENGHAIPPGDTLLRLLDYYRVTNFEVSKEIAV